MQADSVKDEAKEVGMRLDYRHMAVKVSFCSDFSHAGELVLAPLASAGFVYPLPHLDTNPTAMTEITAKLAFGNAVDFGLDSAGRRIYGLYVSNACDWNDMAVLTQTIQCSLLYLSQNLPPVKTAIVAPLSEDPEFEPINQFFFQAFCAYFQPQSLLLPVQSQTSKDSLKRIFAALVQAGYSLDPPITRNDLEDIMRLSQLKCALCHEYAENTLMSQCCQVLACRVCTQYCQHCPTCLLPANWMENKPIRMQVNDLQYVCQCEEAMLVGQVSSHLRSCTFSQFRCKACQNGDIYTKSDLLEHLKSTHQPDILRKLREARS